MTRPTDQRSLNRNGSEWWSLAKVEPNHEAWPVTMKSLPRLILDIAEQLPEGEVLRSGRFLHLSSRSAVQRALARLVVEQKLFRVDRGFYVAAVDGRFGRRSPAPTRVVRSLANALGEMIVEHGDHSANKLGLSTQIPVRCIFLSTGRSRELHIGKKVVSIRHAPKWLMALGETGAGDAVRALESLGPLWAADAVPKLHERLPEGEWSALVRARGTYPS